MGKLFKNFTRSSANFFNLFIWKQNKESEKNSKEENNVIWSLLCIEVWTFTVEIS